MHPPPGVSGIKNLVVFRFFTFCQPKKWLEGIQPGSCLPPEIEGNKVGHIANLSNEDSWFEMRDARAHGDYKEVFSGKSYEFIYQRWFEMKPWEYWVMEKI